MAQYELCILLQQDATVNGPNTAMAMAMPFRPLYKGQRKFSNHQDRHVVPLLLDHASECSQLWLGTVLDAVKPVY